MDIVGVIDHQNAQFINHAKAQLADLSQYTTPALEWLMMEHYQFSLRNTRFLADAATTTGAFDTPAVRQELTRNFNEESGHAVMYKAALKQVDVDVDTRNEFVPTTRFLETIGTLVERDPSFVLGAMFATETAAIFEHEVFHDISAEIIARRAHGERGAALMHFHDMHLDGVEQSHRDELGIFLRGLDPSLRRVERDGERPTIEPQQAVGGAEAAISAMTQWWAELFTELRARSQASA